MKVVQMHSQTTKKLFYNKWPYKVGCTVRGSYKVSQLGVEKTIIWCNGEELNSSYSSDKFIDKIQLRNFSLAVEPFLKKDLQIRSEGHHFNIFCGDEVVFNQLKHNLKQWVRATSSPGSKEELEFLLENGHKKSLCNKLPFEKYQYKLYFKESFPLDQREKFLKWTSNYGDRIHIADGTLKFFLGTVKWKQDPFMYVEDRKMLSMMLLYLGDYSKKILEYIPKDSINT